MSLLVVLMCRLFLKWCALQRLPQLARQRTCVLAMVAKDGGCCAGCRRCRFSTSYDAILNANLQPLSPRVVSCADFFLLSFSW